MTRRYSLELDDEIDRVINGLARSMNCSRDDVWSRAIALLESVVKAEQAGHQVVIREKDGTAVRRIVGIIPGDES